MKPSRRMRFVFAFLGAVAAMVAALLSEALFGATNAGGKLDRLNTPALLFVDAFGRRLQREGGQTGDVRITLLWNNHNDLDLWCIDPTGERIFFMHPRGRTGGRLDVDMNANSARLSNEPVENIFWPVGGAPRGRYQVLVDHFAVHGAPDPTDYEVEVYNHGATSVYNGSITHSQPARLVTAFQAGAGTSAIPYLPRGFTLALVLSALWGMLLALALYGALTWALYLIFGRPPLRPRWWGIRAARAAGTGLLAGAAGQTLFSLILTALPMLPGAVPRVVGWIVLGLLLGYGLSGIVPCMPRGLAARCGVFGGILAFLGFHAFVIGGDGPSRIAAAVLLGALIGWAVSVVLPEPRPEPPEPRRLAAFSARAHRLTPTGVLTRHASGHLSARPLSLSGTAAPTRDGAAPFTDD